MDISVSIEEIKIKAYLEFIVRDKDGNIITYKKQPAHSWVIGMIRALRALLAGSIDASTESITDTSGYAFSYPAAALAAGVRILGINCGAGVDSCGIVIGTGTAAVSLSQTALQAKIAHGASAGAWQYQATSVSSMSVGTNTASFTISRSFVNSTGSQVTVNEVGLYAAVDQSAGSKYFMIARDLISGGVAVPNGATLTVTYTVSLTV